MSSRASVPVLSAPHKPVVRCQDMRCRLALSISDLPFDANREHPPPPTKSPFAQAASQPHAAQQCAHLAHASRRQQSPSRYCAAPLTGWVEDLFRTAPPGVDTARLLEDCEGSVERSDAAAFMETVSAVA